jgi:hydroxymethylpyrimidine pyrophosphatase-like HAD family hydrolase
MYYNAFATDYDGTLAFEGTVDDRTVHALQRARAEGYKLIMVTGRELSDLFNTFVFHDQFDRIVAENGAVLYNPATRHTNVLAAPPPPELLQTLTQKQIPLSVGHSIVATVSPHEHAVLEAIRDLGIEWHVIFNKESVMALPSGVNKATGLEVALHELRVPAKRTIGIGDAENDHAFLQRCGFSVAVANALPSLKSTVNLVTDGARGEGVVEVIERLLRGDISKPAASASSGRAHR